MSSKNAELKPPFNVRPNKNGYVLVGGNQYFRHYKKLEKGNPLVSQNLHGRVLDFIFKRIWHYMLNERFIFKAPLNLGEFYICEVTTKSGQYLSIPHTIKERRKVFLYNYHTGGRKYFIKWNKYLVRLRNKSMYYFKSTRGKSEEYYGSRGLSGFIMNRSQDPNKPDFRGHLI